MWSRREQGRPQLSGSGLPRGSLRGRPETDKQRAEEVVADTNEDNAVDGSAIIYEVDEAQGSRDEMLKDEIIVM